MSPCSCRGRGTEKDRRGSKWAIKRHYVSHHQNELNMTRTEFYLKACIAFATNSKVIRDNLTAEQHVSNIHYLAEQLTAKVSESADFDPEYSLQ